MNKRIQLLRECLRIRLIEEKIIEIYPSDKIQSPVHLSIGQEAVAVGVNAATEESDKIFINYRGHAMYLARGGDLGKFFAELMGKKSGISKGKAGSMHLTSPDNGVMGASAVVASSIPHSLGYALAEKFKGGEAIAVTNFGDGAMEQGVFHECLNFANIHRLKMLFLCEDNQLAVHTQVNERQSFKLEKLCKAYSMKYFECKQGFDPDQVLKKTSKALNYIKKAEKPALLKVETCRYKEHVGPGEDHHQNYRDNKIMEAWKKRDPVELIRKKETNFVEGIKKEIENAVKYGELSMPCSSEEVLTDVI